MTDLENAQPTPEAKEALTPETAQPQPTSPVEAQPSSPAEAQPSSPAEAQPSSPVEARSSSPAEAQPSSPVEARPSRPAEAQPSSPAAAPAHPMDTEMAEAFAYQTLKRGQILDGIIVSISPTEILVDVGSKSEGVIRGRELEQMDKELLAGLKEGGDVLVYVIRPEDRQGNVILSLSRAQQEQDWRDAQRLLDSREYFESKVVGCNRGGLIVEMGRLRGFAPASQLASEYHDEKPPKAAEGANRWAHMVGKSLLFKVIELDRQRNRLILSERLAMREWRRGQREQLLDELHKGDIRKGVVTTLTDFGAFVDLGGADGLIHLSELSWGQVGHPSEVLEIGQEVEAYVLKVDRKRRRIGLSLRQLQPEPWAVVHEHYAVGQLVEGVITNLTDFGAFARVGPGIEGLIHISELADYRVNHPREVVQTGQKMMLRIIRIDTQRRRMALSLKQAAEDGYVEFDWREASDEAAAEEEPFEPAGLGLAEEEVEALIGEEEHEEPDWAAGLEEEAELVVQETEPVAPEPQALPEEGAAMPEEVAEEAVAEAEPAAAEAEAVAEESDVVAEAIAEPAEPTAPEPEESVGAPESEEKQD